MNAMKWNDQTPIFRQLKEKVVELIMDGEVQEGEAVPSVRQVAADYQINPLTVSKRIRKKARIRHVCYSRCEGAFV
jgi:GntR family transcriptional regulator